MAGCRTLTRSKYCDRHADTDAVRAKAMEAARSRDPYRRLYNRKAWTQTRRIVLQRDIVCQICRLAPATEVDHKINGREWVAMGKAWADQDNLQGLCHECHSRKTIEETGLAGWNRE